MFREGSISVRRHLPAHFQKHSCRITSDPRRTDRCAEAAEVTGKRELLPGFGVRSPERGNGLGRTVFLQKTAFPDTEAAGKAVLYGKRDVFHQMLR